MSAREPTDAAHEREHRRWRSQLADLFDGKVPRLMLPIAVGALAATAALPQEAPTVTGAPPVWISTSPLSSMTAGSCQTLLASGATSFSVTGLPAELTLSSGGVLCATVAGSYGPFLVTATNDFGSTAKSLSVVVTAPSLFPPVWDITTSIDPMTVGQVFCQSIQASGATSYSLATGSIPPGLCLDDSGLLVFCPTTAGTYTFTITATNADGSTVSPTFTATVSNGVPIWSTTSLGTVTRTVPFSLQLVASDTTSYTILSGSLPAGLTMTSGGLVSGTPTAAVAYGPVVIRAVGTGGNTSQSFSGTVAAPAGPTWVTTTPLDATAVGQFYCLPFEAVGVGIVTYAVFSGTIPAGLCFDASGLMMFCPTTAATYNFTIRASDSNGSTNQAFTITVDPTASLPPASTTAPTTMDLWVSGDSTTDGYPAPGTDAYYPLLTDPAWSSARGGAYLSQRTTLPATAYPGWTDSSLGGLIPDYVYSNAAIYGNPTKVVIMGGTNDLYGATADGTLSGLLARMQAAATTYDTWLSSNGIARLWVTAPPLAVPTNQSGMNAVRTAYNSWLMTTLAPTNHVDLSSLENPDGTWQSGYAIFDNIHPGPTGRAAIAMLVQAQL